MSEKTGREMALERMSLIFAEWDRRSAALPDDYGQEYASHEEYGVAAALEFNEIADEMDAAGVTWTAADKSPGSRENGWQKLRSMLKNTSSIEEPGLYVFEHCRHFIRTIPTLPRSETKREDVNTNAEDHVGDETRYRIYTKRHTMERQSLGGL